MAQDISGTGIQVNLVASTTFPQGFTISLFADDGDPVDIPSQQIADSAMTLNGDLLKWSTATPIPMTINVAPNSDEDINLSILAEANRIGRGKSLALDEISATVIYPNGDVLILSGGYLTDVMAGNSVASAGRLKTKAYIFTFENKADA